MKKIVGNILIAYGCAVTSVSGQAAGFTTIDVADQGQPDLQVGLWYPTSEQPPAAANTKFGLSVAHDALLHKPNGGLVVISHGYSGWYAGHADTAAALADAGFIVAAPTHTGNTWSDMSSAPDQWALDRPRHATKVIDHMLNAHEFSSVIDGESIGVYGFSAGGYTAVGLIGGVPDFAVATQHCEQQPEEFVCADGLIGALISADMQSLPDEAWGYDARISAAVISAPGWGFAYTANSLVRVSADVQLWSGKLDESVPTASNAALLAQRLPTTPETHWVEDANHFAFLTVPCREAFKKEDPDEYEMICGDADGFDRHKFHDDMHAEMVRFYKESFSLDR